MTLIRTVVATLLASLILFTSSAEAGVEVKKSNQGMDYSIRLPSGHDVRKSTRLVFAMHGRGGNHARFMRIVNQGASHLADAILVAPNAPTNAQWSLDDLPVIAKLIDEVKAEHSVSHTIMFGFSMGAYCSFSMGLRYPDKIQAVIPHSGGIPIQVPTTAGVKKQAFYVIHGDADSVVPVSQSQSGVKQLKAAGVARLHYEEIPGLAHRIDPKATHEAFKWVARTLKSAAATSVKETEVKITALETALKAKEWSQASEALEGLKGAPRSHAKKIAALAKKAIQSRDSGLALAGVEAAGRLGALGLGALKSVSKADETLSAAAARSLAKIQSPKALKPLLAYLRGRSETVAIAAAEALGESGKLVALPTLIRGLSSAEKSPEKAERAEAIRAALEKLTGESFDSAKGWSRWNAQRSK